MRFARTYLILMLAMPAIGCGSKNEVKLVPVSGVVKTPDGTPVENAVVSFTPRQTAKIAPTSTGTTDAEGRFTLKAPDGREGAMVGAHSVSITKTIGDEDDDSGEALQELIPAKYNAETTQEFTVSDDGSDSANFTVEVRKPKKR